MTEEATQQAPATGTETTEERTFTQADLKKIAANEKRDGRQAAINDLLDKTGAESIDDVLAAYTEYQGIQEAVTSEADRANERAERLEKRAKQAEERYASTLREYALRDALRDSGINSGRLPLALKVADLSALELDGSGIVSGVESVVESIREASPEWFATEERRPVRSPEATQQGRPRENSYEGQQASFIASLLNGT